MRRGIVVLALVASLVAPTAAQASITLAGAQHLARKVARKIATINDADDWALRRCSRQDGRHILCTVLFYGYDSGSYDCRETLMLYGKPGDREYIYSRLYSSTC